MKQIHMRLSIVVDVTDEQFKEIAGDLVEDENGRCCDVNYEEIPEEVRVKIENGEYQLSDWDDGGYIPADWIEFDADNQREG